MLSTPFFFLGIVLFLAWFTTDVHSEKVLLGLKGSSVVLSPGDTETSIISITWKHGADLAAEWFGGNPTFYRIFNDGCSLNTKTGELTISDVRPEHGGEYTPEMNGKILSALKLQVFSPVPKPRITPDCNPEKTNCTLTCSFDRTDDLGDVEVFWILDDRRENRTELQITKDTKEETFICSLKNPVSSQNSTELKNPLHPTPVPKPRITHDCNPEKTKCTLTCSFDRTDDLGDVEVFWILDDRRENDTEIQITKETKEETFICSLKNPVSSENSTELKNPLFSGGTSLYYLLILLVIPLIGVAVFLIFHFKIFRGRNEQRSSAAEEQKALNDERNTVVWKPTEMNGVTENTRGKTKQWIPNHHNTTRKTLWRHGSAQEVQHFKNGVKPSSDGWRRCSYKMESLEVLEPHKETIMESFSLN